MPLETVRETFARYGLLDDQVTFIEGWFRDTLPLAPLDEIAVLRLDGDMYESTWQALTSLYPKVSPGGFLIIDDYGAIPACQSAVDAYRAQFAIGEPLTEIDWTECTGGRTCDEGPPRRTHRLRCSACLKPVHAFLPPGRITDRPFWAGHVPFALWLMEQHRPQLTVELGTETGVSLAAFSQAAAALDIDCEIHGIDSWEGESHTGHYAGVFEDLRAYFSKKGYGFTHLHRMLFDEALALFEDNSIDLLHIDGATHMRRFGTILRAGSGSSARGLSFSFMTPRSTKATLACGDFGRKSQGPSQRRVQTLERARRHLVERGASRLALVDYSRDSNRTLTITPFARNLFEALGNRALEVSQSYVLQGALERAEEQLVERQREWHSLDAENKALQEALAKAEELLVKGQPEWHSALAKAEELLVERQQEWHSVDAQYKALQRALAEADDLLMKRLQEWHSLDAQMRLAQEALATRLRQLER